jgi:hypothetical protein
MRSKPEKYRENARNCNELAEATENESSKKQYRWIAAAWLNLAEEKDWLEGQASSANN